MMSIRKLALCVVAGCGLALSGCALPSPIASEMQDRIDVTLQPGATRSHLVGGLDTYTWEITTDSAEAQAWFNQGVALLYG